LLGGARSAALLAFRNHANVGDSAIRLGELAYLRSLGSLPLRYPCDVDSYSRATLAERVRGGISLLSGGGRGSGPGSSRDRVHGSMTCT
jgi:pyruvyl transferase EpsO